MTGSCHFSQNFRGNNDAHVILTAEADSSPIDQKELLDDYGLVGCHSSRSNDLSYQSTPELIPQDMFAFHGNKRMTKRDMLQSLRSSLAKDQRRQLHNCHGLVSERLSISLTTWSLLHQLWKAMIIPLTPQQDASMTPRRGNW